VWQPAFSDDKQPRLPSEVYIPQPGDIVFHSDPTPLWTITYAIAGTGPPGHTGLVVRMADGRLGILEAGYDEKVVTRTTPLDTRLRMYKGTVWVRRRSTPPTECQSARLTEFSQAVEGNRYPVLRLLAQMTPLRARGPIRTIFFGKPHGIKNRYICAEATLEGLVYAGLLPHATTRPAATFPRDMFLDTSRNPYIDRHGKLEPHGWEAPRLWVKFPGPRQ